MSTHPPILHLLCGRIASGKSTLAARLAADPATVLIAEDSWLAALYADRLATLDDYLRCAARLRRAMGPHVAALLNAGVLVVLDFPANTPRQRAWMRGLVEDSAAAHALHVLDLPEEVCLARLRARNAAGSHPFAVTEAQFRDVSRHFATPTREEGFVLVRHDGAAQD